MMRPAWFALSLPMSRSFDREVLECASPLALSVGSRHIRKRQRTGALSRQRKADTELSQTGALAGGVPGALAAYEYAVQHVGKKKLKDLILPAAELAEKGFRLDASYAHRLKAVAGDMARFDSSRAVFFKD